MTRTLLIIGGSGYLGSRLVIQAQTPWHVVATYYSNPPSSPECQMLSLDIRDAAAVARLMIDLRPHVVIHTAAIMSPLQAMQEVIVAGTGHVAAQCAAVGSHLLHLSTDALFDGEHGPYLETDPPSPITPYGKAKAAAEQSVADICPGATIVRTSLIYGFDPPDPRTVWVLDSVRQGQSITLFTDEVRCPVWVDQLASALLELAWTERGGMWHLAGPQPLTRYEFGERLVNLYGLDPAGITPGLSRESGQIRPRDCRLDPGKAQVQLRSPLWGVDRVLRHAGPQAIG